MRVCQQKQSMRTCQTDRSAKAYEIDMYNFERSQSQSNDVQSSSTKHLHASLNALSNNIASNRQQNRRWYLWVHLLILLIVTGGTFLYVRSVERGFALQVELHREKRQILDQENLKLKSELEGWNNVEASLVELDGLIRSGNKELAVERFTQLENLKFSGLLLQLVSRFKKDVAREKYNLGVDHYEKGSFRRADDSLQLALRYDSQPDYLGMLTYYRGMASVRLKRYLEAADFLENALKLGLKKRHRVQARFYRAYSYDRLGRRRLAREHYRIFKERHSKHPFAKQARARYEALKRRK